MALHNPNNWHWVNKDVSAWTKTYLGKTLVGIFAEESGVTAKTTKLVSMDGDVDVSQRKGKVITLFDVQLNLEYQGTTKDGDDVSGSIKIPEVAHDTEEDEYVVRIPNLPTPFPRYEETKGNQAIPSFQFNVDIYSDALSKQPVKDLVRTKIVPRLRAELQKLAPALIAEHGKDLQHAPGENPADKFKPAMTYSAEAAKKKEEEEKKAAAAAAKSATTTTTTSTTSTAKPIAMNTTTVTATDEFKTTAEEMYITFTDPQRIAAFTRAPPRVFEGAQVGGKFSLFDGNVSGEYTSLTPHSEIKQKWRLAQWPAGHYADLTIGFDQNDIDRVTSMRCEFKGVPVGQEDVVKRNWEGYYVRSIKATFG
ncbi:hypothetical protein KEM56_000426 [Ascosphaera pollenicola]|nr:hypothetical protein KEM56_000426 [Ascosphaera pollenicola]